MANIFADFAEEKKETKETNLFADFSREPATTTKKAPVMREPEEGSGEGNFFSDFVSAETAPRPEPLTPRRKTPPQFEFKYSADLYEDKPEFDSYKEALAPDQVKIMKTYLSNQRFGDAAKDIDKLTDEEVFNKFMTTMRMVEWNPEFNGVPELQFLQNANQKDKEDAIRAHQLFERIPGFLMPGGAPTARGFGDVFSGLLSSPSTAISIGAGTAAAPVSGPLGPIVGTATAAAKSVAGRATIKAALKNILTKTGRFVGERKKAIGVGAATEAALTVPQSVLEQKLEIETLKKDAETGELKTEIDPARVLFDSTVSSLFGAAAGLQVAKKTGARDLEKLLEAKKTEAGVKAAVKRTREEEEFIKKFDEMYGAEFNKVDIFQGRQTLDELIKPTELADAKVRNDVQKRAIDVAKYIMAKDPSFRPREGQLVSDAVKNVFMSLETDEITDEVVLSAIKKSGLNPTQFAQAARASVTDAASLLNNLSYLSKFLNRGAKVDPAMEEALAKIHKEAETPTVSQLFFNGVRRLERESKAFVVSSIGTTMRNVLGTGIGMTFKSGARLFESSLYHLGKGSVSLLRGNVSIKGTKDSFSNIMRDSFGDFFYLKNQDLTKNIVEKLLVDQPKLNDMLFHVTRDVGQDTAKAGSNNISTGAKFVNKLNAAQDAFFRRAVFASSVDKQLRDVGMDMLDMMANDKAIPKEILQKASDDALKATFSYMPKTGAANFIVRGLEQTPFASLVVPFPRFMANAISFIAEYFPYTNAVKAVGNTVRTIAKIKDPKAADAAWASASEDVGKAIAGGAALLAAYQYREENPDVPWSGYKTSDGSIVDTRAIFPMGPMMGIAELHRMAQAGDMNGDKIKEILETLAVMKLPSGTVASIFTNIPQAAADILSGAETKAGERLLQEAGDLAGSFITRFFQPGQPVLAMFSDFNKEAGVAVDTKLPDSSQIVQMMRDNGMLGENESVPFLDAAMVPIESKIPGLREGLPTTVPRLREETPVRGAELFAVLTGIRFAPPNNPIEKEFTRLGLNEYKLFGRSSNRDYQRAYTEMAAKRVQKSLTDLMESGRYKEKMNDDERRAVVAARVKKDIELSKKIMDAKFLNKDPAGFWKMQFDDLTKPQRRLANAEYAKRNEGRGVEEDIAYKKENNIKYNEADIYRKTVTVYKALAEGKTRY